MNYTLLAIDCIHDLGQRQGGFTLDQAQAEIRQAIADSIPADALDVFAQDLSYFADEIRTDSVGFDFAGRKDKAKVQAERKSPYRRLAAEAYQRVCERGRWRLDDVRKEIRQAIAGRFPADALDEFIDCLTRYEDQAMAISTADQFDLDRVLHIGDEHRVRFGDATKDDLLAEVAYAQERIEKARVRLALFRGLAMGWSEATDAIN